MALLMQLTNMKGNKNNLHTSVQKAKLKLIETVNRFYLFVSEIRLDLQLNECCSRCCCGL